jgi:hypothetical protein
MRRISLAKSKCLTILAGLVLIRALLFAFEYRELRRLSERPPSVDPFA